MEQTVNFTTAPDSPSYAADLKAARQSLGWSQERMAKEAGHSRMWQNQLEGGKILATPKFHQNIVDALARGNANPVAAPKAPEIGPSGRPIRETPPPMRPNLALTMKYQGMSQEAKNARIKELIEELKIASGAKTIQMHF